MKLPKLTKKQWMVGGVILLVLIAIGIYLYLQYRRKKGEQEEGAKVIPLIPEPTVALFSDCPNDSFPLKYGKCGKRVEQFQMHLIKQFGAQFSAYGVDGKWGEETDMLAKKFILKNEPFSISEDYFLKTGMDKLTTVKYA